MGLLQQRSDLSVSLLVTWFDMVAFFCSGYKVAFFDFSHGEPLKLWRSNGHSS